MASFKQPRDSADQQTPNTNHMNTHSGASDAMRSVVFALHELVALQSSFIGKRDRAKFDSGLLQSKQNEPHYISEIS
jgi:hypothetical protein